MKNTFNVLSIAVAVSMLALSAQADNKKPSSTPNYGGSSSSYKYNAPTITYGNSSSSKSSGGGSSYSSGSSYGKGSSSSYSPSSVSSSKPNYGGSSSNYKYNAPTVTYGNSSSSKSNSGSSSSNYGSNSSSSKPNYGSSPSYGSNSSSKPSTTPNYGGSSSNYKYNDYTYSKPKYNVGKPVQPKNNGGYNNGGYSSNQPQTNKNGTVLLKELQPGQSRIRADGTTDKVHKDGKGFTHTFVDKNGSTRKESIRYDKTGKEVKISDTERRTNGDVVTKYKSGVSEIRTRDGLRYQQDRYGKTVYQEKYSTWNNRPVIYRQYNNNYTTVYVQNNYYGYPSYFYRPSYYDYNYYNWTLTAWSRPVSYSWHWSYNPWYNNYYRPYVNYYSPAYWLTDYLLMSLIQSNYDRIAADNEVLAVQQQYNQVALNDQIKDEIRAQVERALRQQQIAVQNNSTMDPAQILTQNRLMVVHSDLTVEESSGGQCQLDEGDVLRLINQPTNQNPIAELKVVSAKGTSCAAGTTLSLSANNLIEMENEFQSRIQQGMTEMKNGNVGK